MEKIKWRIYYGNGTTFDNTEGSGREAPPVGVQVIVCYNEDGIRHVVHKWDWYYLKKEEWWGCDVFGLLDQLLYDSKGEVLAIKQGRTVSDKTYESLLKKAINDKDFLTEPKKTDRNSPQQAYGDGMNG